MQILHVGTQGALVLLLFWGWVGFVLRVLRYDPVLAIDRYVIFSSVVILGLLLDSARRERMKESLIELEPARARRITTQQTAVIVGALFVFLFATRDQIMSRLFLFSFIPALYLLLFVSNRFLPRAMAGVLFTGDYVHKALLLGSSKRACELRPWLRRKARYGIRPVGLLTDEIYPTVLDGIPHIGTIADTESVIRSTGATQLIVVEMPQRTDGLSDVADVCERLGVRCMILHNFEEQLRHPIHLIEDEGLHFIGLHHEPLDSPVNRLLKRILDLAIAVPVVLFVLPPVALIVWASQRIQSPGPLFWFQYRSGVHKQVFRLWKFRTMHVSSGGEDRQACRNDERVYPTGRWLRRLSLDELPQFINVLRNEMSVVGPRPHLVEHNERFSKTRKRYHVRSFIKPGVTGLAQVRGFRGEIRTEDDLVSRIEADIHYVENWSLMLDWQIVFRTAWQMIAPPSTAY